MEILELCMKHIQRSEAYLQPSWKFQLFFVNYFCKRAPFSMLNCILNTRVSIVNNKGTWTISSTSFLWLYCWTYFAHSLSYFTHKFIFQFFWTSKHHLENFQKLKEIYDLIHFSNFRAGKVFIWKNVLHITTLNEK